MSIDDAGDQAGPLRIDRAPDSLRKRLHCRANPHNAVTGNTDCLGVRIVRISRKYLRIGD